MKPSYFTRDLKNSALATELTDPQFEALLQAATVVTHGTPTALLTQGGPAPGIYLVISGNVGISVVDAHGKQSNLVRAGKGDVLGDLETIAERECLATCVTESDTTLLLWDRAALRDLLSDPQFVKNLVTLSYNRIAVINNLRTLEQAADAKKRIAVCLLRMSQHCPRINQSQSFLAEAVGCSRQTMNRCLGRLRDKGLIEIKKSEITILDRTGLAALAEDQG